MNSTKWGLLAVALTIIAIGSAIVLVVIPAPKTPIDMATTTNSTATSTATSTADKGDGVAGIPDLITVNSPAKEASIGTTSATVTGSARGPWYFEASFPVQIKDASGKIIAQGPAEAQSDWMTQDFVSFKITLTYPAQPSGSKGTVVLMNDNPSGDPANQKEVDIPVTFK